MIISNIKENNNIKPNVLPNFILNMINNKPTKNIKTNIDKTPIKAVFIIVGVKRSLLDANNKPIKDENSHDDSDEYADLPDLIPIDDLTQVVDEPKNEPHVADNKIYIDDDIQDVTDQYLAKKEAEKEANKVIVDLTLADDKNTTSDKNKNTTSDKNKNTTEYI